MSRRPRPKFLPWLGLAGVLAFIVVARAGAVEPQLKERFQAQIEAGEFAPALETARQIANLDERDAFLAQIGEAQARAGAREASLNTAAEIGSDRTRAQALSQIHDQPLAARGGGSMADFDSLIDLIQNTVAPDSWSDTGGNGTIEPFPTGVIVDPKGFLRRLGQEELSGDLAALRRANAPRTTHSNARKPSALRNISLNRLEKQVQLRLAAGRMPTEEMLVLAGLQRVRYLFVYPESGDIVLAGPAGDWKPGPEDRIISAETGRPVVRLDDLVVVLRNAMTGPEAKFGCTITPRQECLARVQQFAQKPMPPGQRKSWMKQIRELLGQQDIEVHGLNPHTRAAQVLVEADYRMKLVGMGLEEGVPGVESYLDLVDIPPGKSPPPFGVIRWWFAMNYDSLVASADRQAFFLRGQGVKVLSENEKLTAEGKRVHTGQSDVWNRQFAQSFTEHFEDLCEKYPVYAELRNLFDLALVCALVREENLPARTGWHLTCFGESGNYPLTLGPAPKMVDSVANLRVIQDQKFGRTHILVGVSGGVRCEPASVASPKAVLVESDGKLQKQQSGKVPKELPKDVWWWDS